MTIRLIVYCCRIAELHRAYRKVCSTEEINSIMTQICCTHFGNGIVDLALDLGIGEKHYYIQPSLSK